MDWLIRRPISVCSTAFVVGAGFEAILPERPEVVLIAFVNAALFCAGALLFPSPHRLLPLTAACLAFGVGLTQLRLPPILPQLTAPFDGIVSAAPLPMRYGYRLLLHLPKEDAFVQLSVLSDDVPHWSIGDCVRVERFWGRPSEHRRYRFRRIFWMGRTEIKALKLQGNADAFRVAKQRERWRAFVFERWQKSLPIRERTVTLSSLASIVFGMRTVAVSQADERAFTRSGLAHLFVPSGAQVTLLMGLAWLAHRYAGLPPLPLLALLLAFYLPLTRGEPSIYRAVLMGLYAFLGWRFFRDVDWQTALWVSSAILVALDPSFLHDVGFQLSYAATFGLIYAAPIFLTAFRWMPDWLRFPVAATMSAQVFLAPVLMHHFGRISVIAPLANLCAVIPASFALMLGFVSALVSLLSPIFAMPVSIIAGEMAKFIVQLAHWFAAPSWASVNFAPLSVSQMLFILGILTALIGWLKSAVAPNQM